MSYLDEALDELVRQATSTVVHPARCNCALCRDRDHQRVARTSGCGCGCGGSEGDDESATRRAARPARRQTSARARGAQLPGWQGWSRPVTLRAITGARAAARQGQPVPLELRPFLSPGPQVYRISRAGIDRSRPLSIGMTKANNSIAQRLTEHYRQPSRADARVHAAIRNLHSGQILVQAARLTRQGMHPRRARLYEGWLQDRERPLLYDPNSTTFDERAVLRSY